MKYLLLLYADEDHWDGQSPEEAAAEMQVWEAYSQGMVDAGVYVAGEALQKTDTATTVRGSSGEVVHTDGPFAETREQLGGFYLIDCESREDALAWASKVPYLGGIGSVEVRPVMDFS